MHLENTAYPCIRGCAFRSLRITEREVGNWRRRLRLVCDIGLEQLLRSWRPSCGLLPVSQYFIPRPTRLSLKWLGNSGQVVWHRAVTAKEELLVGWRLYHKFQNARGERAFIILPTAIWSSAWPWKPKRKLRIFISWRKKYSKSS